MTISTADTRVDYVVIPPDGGWGWFIVFVAFIWNLVVDGTVFSFGIFLEEMKRDFEVSTAFLSLASSLQMGLYFILGPLVAAMINRCGFRIVSMLGGTLAFAGVLSTAYMNNIYGFIGTFGGILGVAFSMSYLSNMLIVGFYFSKYRAIATCIAVTGTAFGIGGFPLIFSVLLKDYNWREKYKFISGAHLLMVLMAIVYKPLQASQVILESVLPEGNISGDSSTLWDEQSYIRHNRNFPTNAEALQNQEYTVVNPYDQQSGRGSSTSVQSTKTIRVVSMTTIYTIQSEMPKYATTKCCGCRCRCRYLMCRCLWHDHRPMYRDDILYHGSTRSLPHYQKNHPDSVKARIGYHMSVTRTSNIIDLPQNADCCMCCPDSVARVLNTMLDLSLLKSFSFFLLCLSGFLTYLGLYVPFIYGIEMSIACNIERGEATYIMTAIGISNGVGRILSGVFTMVPRANAMVITQVTLVIAGSAVVVHPFLTQFTYHIICVSVFGLNIASISSLRTVIVVDLLGLEKLTNAFGLIVLIEGLSSLVALPLNSFLYDYEKDFMYPCVFSGGVIILSGLILIPVVPLNKREKRTALKKDRIKKEKLYAEAQKAATTSRSRK